MSEKTVMFTVTRLLYVALAAGVKNRPARVPAGLARLVEFVELVANHWEEAEDDVRGRLGHGDFALLAVDVFTDGSTQARWQELGPPGPHEGRLHLGLLRERTKAGRGTRAEKGGPARGPAGA
jgi:hypothetical protein